MFFKGVQTEVDNVILEHKHEKMDFIEGILNTVFNPIGYGVYHTENLFGINNTVFSPNVTIILDGVAYRGRGTDITLRKNGGEYTFESDEVKSITLYSKDNLKAHKIKFEEKEEKEEEIIGVII